MREAAHLAVAFGGGFKVQSTQGMRLGGVGFDACGFEQFSAYQVRQLPFHGPQAQIHAGFAKVHRQQLRMAVSHVQKRHLTKTWHVVQAFSISSVFLRKAGQGHTTSHASTQHLQKFTFGQVHIYSCLLVHGRFRIEQQRHEVLQLGFSKDGVVAKARHVRTSVVASCVP